MKPTNVFLLGLLLTASLMAGGTHPGYAQVRFTVQPGSRLWIEGSSTMGGFTCDAQDIEGEGVVHPEAESDRAAGSEAEVVITVPVRQFDCGKKQMNHDLYRALKAQQFPTIRYELEQAEQAALQDTAEAAYPLLIDGQLTIAGTARRIEATVTGVSLGDGRYRLNGNVPLNMSDFGVKPPSALLGLIKAHDRIVVWFDLLAAPETMYSSEELTGDTAPHTGFFHSNKGSL